MSGSEVVQVMEPTKSNTWSVYDAFTPFGILAKAVGLFPVRNILRGPYAAREWITIFIFPVFNVLEHLVLYLQDPEHITYIYVSFGNVREYVATLENYNQTVCSCGQFILMQSYLNKICAVFRKLHNFDSKVKQNVNGTLRKVAVGLCVTGVTYAVFFVLEFYLMDGLYEMPLGIQIPMMMHILCNMVILFPLFFVIFLSEAIRLRFALITRALLDITDKWPKTFPDSETTDNGDMDESISIVETETKMTDRLSDLCGACDELTETIADVSEAMGYSLSLGFLCLLFDIICMISSIFIDEEGWAEYVPELLGLIGEVVMRLVLLVSTTLILSRIETEATKSLKNLYRVRIVTLDPDCKELVLQLSQRLSSPSFRITGADFFDVNRGLLTAIGTAITTYIIVLVQFKDSEKQTPAVISDT